MTLTCGIGQPLKTTYCNTNKQDGIHKLQSLGHTNKHQLNIEALRDFVIMCNAKHIIHDDVSLFSKMAEQCRDVPLYD